MYLVSYDIASDRIRNKVAKELCNYGKRVQYSVFECNISLSEYKKLYEKLLRLVMDEEDANIRIYMLDKDVYSRTVVIGNDEREYEDMAIFI